MKLYFVPMWHESTKLMDEDYELFEDVWELVSRDDPLGDIFISHEIANPISVPYLKNLNKGVEKPFFQKILHALASVIFLSDMPYGDEAFGTYTTRYMEEIATKLEWDKLNGRVLALTNVSLKSYRYGYFDLQLFSQLYGGVLTKKSAVVSVAQFGYNAFKIYKECKHELGHTFELSNCSTRYCIMNHVEKFDKRSTLYCPTCKENMIVI